MEKNIRIPRLRMKPLQFWENERIQYNIKGEIARIEAPPSSELYKLVEKNPDIITKSEKTKKHSKKKTSSTKPSSAKKNHKIKGTSIRNFLSSNQTKTDKEESSDANLLVIHKDAARGHNKNGCLDYQPPVDISQLKNEELEKSIFKLIGMYKMVTARGESCYLERGPYHSSSGLYTGFLFLKEPVLHWGKVTSPREIFVIEGDGEVQYTVAATGTVLSKRLFKSANYDILPEGDLMLKKDEACPFLKLFVVFTHINGVVN